jgi:hypothetical protein
VSWPKEQKKYNQKYPTLKTKTPAKTRPKTKEKVYTYPQIRIPIEENQEKIAFEPQQKKGRVLRGRKEKLCR